MPGETKIWLVHLVINLSVSIAGYLQLVGIIFPGEICQVEAQGHDELRRGSVIGLDGVRGHQSRPAFQADDGICVPYGDLHWWQSRFIILREVPIDRFGPGAGGSVAVDIQELKFEAGAGVSGNPSIWILTGRWQTIIAILL